jgi:myo-inositol-1(or 4)-monophosphatase
MEHLQTICAAIEKAEREAAELILHAHGILAETKSGRRDVVTEYDRRVQALLMQRLGEAVPGARFFCEEQDEHDRLDAERLFIIDPIDGTMNFVHGFHHSCVSVAYAERGEVLIGVIYNPYMDELFAAVKGNGAYLNGRPIRVTEEGLAGSVVCYGTAPYNPELTEQTFETAKKLYDASLDVRREGSAALDLCTVAAGRAGLYFELKVSLWDYAAGDLIVREAGGVCCRADGSPFPADGSRTGIAAGSPKAMEEFLTLLKT